MINKIKNLFCKNSLQIILFQDQEQKWRWRICSKNHEILCTSEAYASRQMAEKTVNVILKSKIIKSQ